MIRLADSVHLHPSAPGRTEHDSKILDEKVEVQGILVVDKDTLSPLLPLPHSHIHLHPALSSVYRRGLRLECAGVGACVGVCFSMWNRYRRWIVIGVWKIFEAT